MRELAISILTSTAVACGLPAQAVFMELENAGKEKIFLPQERMEISLLDETFTRQGWRTARVQTANPLVCRTRYAKYRVTLPVRMLVRGTDPSRLDALCNAFLVALPSKTRDSAGNPVRIEAHKASRQGYTFASIRIEDSPVQALHISFSGIVFKDVDTGFITTITIHPKYEVQP